MDHLEWYLIAIGERLDQRAILFNLISESKFMGPGLVVRLLTLGKC